MDAIATVAPEHEAVCRELWRVATEQLISGANPITYMGKDGKQYVAVAAGTTLLTYNLP